MGEVLTVQGPQLQTTIPDEIQLTEKAAAEVRNIKSSNNIPESHGLRLGVKGGGCLGIDVRPRVRRESKRERSGSRPSRHQSVR